MSIQSTGFPLVLQPNDFQRIDFGVKWGIKCQRIAGFGEIVYVTWFDKYGTQFQETLDDAFDIHVLEYEGDVIDWLKKYLLPRLNAWLAKTFKAGAVVEPDGLFEQAHNAINSIKITVNADGTLTASL